MPQKDTCSTRAYHAGGTHSADTPAIPCTPAGAQLCPVARCSSILSGFYVYAMLWLHALWLDGDHCRPVRLVQFVDLCTTLEPHLSIVRLRSRSIWRRCCCWGAPPRHSDTCRCC